MGASVEIEGGRRTRSSARGSTPATPPPAKKPRTVATPSTGIYISSHDIFGFTNIFYLHF
jgi:hypothetical protein